MEVTTEQALIEMIRQMNIAQEALEQHHKDLMGLVEAWRRMSSLRDSPFSDDIASIIGGCADQLESLINPKD